MASFINGQVMLHPTAAAAARGKAIRMGPPFKFQAKAGTRGTEALLSIGVLDENGCTLRIASSGRKEAKIRIRLSMDGETKLATTAEYG